MHYLRGLLCGSQGLSWPSGGFLQRSVSHPLETGRAKVKELGACLWWQGPRRTQGPV